MEYLIVPVWSFNRNTALEIHRDEKKVRFIPLAVDQPLRVEVTSIHKFDEEWTPIPSYNVQKAINHFHRLGMLYGALKEVRLVLGIEAPIKQVEEPETKVAKHDAPKPVKEKKLTISAMFMELIMQGALTDDEIFAKVKEAFDLEDKKRSYVNWYRKHLIKSGKTPPQPLGEVKCNEEKKAATTATSTPRNSAKPAMAKRSTGTIAHTSGVGALPAALSRAKITSSKSAVVKTAPSAKSSPMAQRRTSTPTSASTSTNSKKAKVKDSASSASSTSSKTGKSSRKK